jgi:phospholipid-binding lipoprotein MlaA
MVMLRHRCTFSIFVSALTLISTAATAESSSDPRRDPSQTIFIDLTKGDMASGMPQRAPTPTTTTRTRHIDLSNGAELPAVNDSEDNAVPALETDEITITADRVNDPYEESNRGRFKTHVALHRNLIDPVETVYMETVPDPVRAGVHNFLTNIESPTIFINNVLQGEVARAGGTVTRFVVNSTIGIAGIFDIAGWMGIPYRDDDFGQTLAVYGVGDYPYLLVPIIGATNPRDLTGKVVDLFLNPLHYVTLPGGFVTSLGHAGLHELDKRSEDAGQLDELSRTAPDPYATERKMARERRNAEITGTETPP